MVNHWKCPKCGSMNVERKFYKKFEASATLYKDEQGKFKEEKGFGTQEEELNSGCLFCKDCKYLGDDNTFTLMPDTD
ncbi:MAG: hypothetical protein Q7S33_04045 [Nanoarchaeota archaeon]|nr:hypothetical protein [Nanoarchaeota archaeon]